jgi:hypothetical protein
MIDEVLHILRDKFADVKWQANYDEGLKQYCVLVNDYDFYRSDKRFMTWKTLLRKKYKNIKFFFAYKKF